MDLRDETAQPQRLEPTGLERLAARLEVVPFPERTIPSNRGRRFSVSTSFDCRRRG